MPSANEPQRSERDRRVASRIATKYGLYECDACAADIIKKLGRGASAWALRIRPVDGSLFIGLARTESLVSNNRSHIGVQVDDWVFDNLHPEGVPAVEWPGRFITRSGALLVVERRPIADFFGAKFRRERFRDWVYRD